MTRFSDMYGDYKYVPRLDWFEDDRNIPTVYYDMGKDLGLKESGQKYKYEELQAYLETTLGKLAWHMFCKVTYDYDLRDDHDSMGSMNIIKDVNSMANPIFDNQRVKEVLTAEGKLGKPIISNRMSPLFGRLFNYHHCYKLGRPTLLKLRPMFNLRNTCPACGCVSAADGWVIEKPSVSVDHTKWSYEDAIEHAGSNLKQETKV